MSLEKLLSENMRRFGTKNLNENVIVFRKGPFTELLTTKPGQFLKPSHKTAARYLDNFNTLKQAAKYEKPRGGAVPEEIYKILLDEAREFKNAAVKFEPGELYNSAIELLKAFNGADRITSFLAPEFGWYRDELPQPHHLVGQTTPAEDNNKILKHVETILNGFNRNEWFRK